MRKTLFIFLLIYSQNASAYFRLLDSHAFDPQPSIIQKVFSRIWDCTWHISCYTEKKLGAFTTLASTDTQSSFPTTYNNNLTKTIEVGTTSVASITTLSGLTSATALASIGTITTGVWNGTVIGVTYGGTGSTTLSNNQVLLGNGTTQLNVVSGLGTSGQFLQSNGAGTAPTWATSAVDQTANYTWTGKHSFGSGSGKATTTVISGFEPYVGIGTTTCTMATFCIELSSTTPAFAIGDLGSTTPVFVVKGGSTTVDFEHTEFNQAVARVTNTAVQSLSGSATSTITFGAEMFKTVAAMHNNSSNTSRLVAPYAGYYEVNGCIGVTTAASLTNEKIATSIFKNGVATGSNVFAVDRRIVTTTTSDTTRSLGICLSALVNMAINDYVEMGIESSGLSLTTTPGETNFMMSLIGK